MTLFENRTENFQRNEMLEQFLIELNTDLQPSERILIKKQKSENMSYPLIFVMGPLRSGTTLFMQWLANTSLVAYPTNLLSRFYQSPIIGAKIQILLTDPRYNFRNELGDFTHQTGYESENGKTRGILAPNEFWYFWRRFLADPERDVWTDEELRQTMNISLMLAELAGIMDVFQKPFAAKGMLFNYNIPFLDSVFEKILFVHVVRDEIANAESVLEARKRQLGDEYKWYSFNIPEKEQLMQLAPFEQALGQVRAINQAIDAGLTKVADSRKILLKYEEFCQSPAVLFDELMPKIGLHNVHYDGVSSFKVTNKNSLQEISGCKFT